MDKTIKLTPLPNYGEHMKLREFINNCKNNSFIDYDGFGYYATKELITNKIVHPSDIINNRIDRNFSYIVWFNR